MKSDDMADWPSWRIGAEIDLMHSCWAVGLEYNPHRLTFWLCSFQASLYRGSGALLGARSHAGTWH